jgi:hypothetical protein
MSQGVIDGHGDQTVAAVGMAMVSRVMILIGALCPLVLFKLLAFVEPHTASGRALRQSWEDSGGLFRAAQRPRRCRQRRRRQQRPGRPLTRRDHRRVSGDGTHGQADEPRRGGSSAR